MIQADTSWITRLLAGEQERAAHIRAVALYTPIAFCVVAYLLRRTRIRTFASPLLSLLWTLPTLLILQRLNLHYGWWSFDTHTACLLGMPVALYLGWAIFWGLLPQLAWPKLDVLSIVIVAFSFDFYVMVYLDPALIIHRRFVGEPPFPVWLIGEAVATLLVLAPAMVLFRWTENDTHLHLRAGGQVVLSALIFLYLIPEVVFAFRPHTYGWEPLLAMAPFLRQLWMQVLLLIAIPGISAVQEFASRGGGTPLPYDPPRRLVVSGIYRYCANPMQLSCATVMFAEALMLRNLWLVAAAAMSTIYSAGLAHWDEEVDLARRFGSGAPPDAPHGASTTAPADWASYRAAVPAWRVRWRPFAAGAPATLYVAATCSTCRGIRMFLEQRSPAGLVFQDAESLPANSIRRMRYVPADGPAESGVLAFGRALEHINFGWAFCGFMLRLPLIHQTAQIVMDTAGFGPRTLPSTCSIGDGSVGTTDSVVTEQDRAANWIRLCSTAVFKLKEQSLQSGPTWMHHGSMQPTVLAVHQSAEHNFSKETQLAVRLIAGIGIEGDAHAGATVQHLHQKRKGPALPNLRQVHLIHNELFDMLRGRGFEVRPGELGENVTTQGVDLLQLPEGTELHLGESAVVRLTGLRTPCVLIDRFCAGLMQELIADAAAKKYLAGVMSVVIASGDVRPGDAVRVVLPEGACGGLRPI